MNLDKRSKPGSHWIAIYIDPQSASVEYFDSFGRDPDKHVMKQLKDLVDSLNLKYLYKLKINKVKHQTDNSNLCGFHSMKFLINRFKGVPFSKASGLMIESKINLRSMRKK
jgi:Ulp1 family protease